MKNNMKKVILVAVSVVLVVAISVTATLAWLKDTTDPVVNTFAPSNIDLKLEESNVDNGSATANTYKMIPGVDIVKDPMVTVTADVDCYVFVKVEETVNFDTYLTYAIADGWKLYDSGETDINTVDNDSYVIYREVTAAEAASGKEFYVLKDNKVAVPNTVTKTQMNALYTTNGSVDTEAQPTLTFTAYAIQQAGFDTPEKAWAEASKLG